MKLSCCDFCCFILVVGMLSLCSVGIYTTTNIETEHCTIISKPIEFVCVRNSGYFDDTFFNYIQYQVYIKRLNLTTIGTFRCNENDCNICPGNSSLVIGATKECYTTPFTEPFYGIGSGISNSYEVKMLTAISSITIVFTICAAGVYLYYKYTTYQTYQSIN